jgi:transcriptional regulator GlxA family with amidase domain
METRLAASKELLLSSSRSIAEVASSTGFSSQSYFSQIFRKNTGMSPLQYRKLKQTDSKTMQDDSYYI